MNFNKRNEKRCVLMIYTHDLSPNSLSFIYFDHTFDLPIDFLTKEIAIEANQHAFFKHMLISDEEGCHTLHSEIDITAIQKIITQGQITIAIPSKIISFLKRHLQLENPHITTILNDVYVEIEGFETFKMLNNKWHFYSSMLHHFKAQLDQSITNASNNAVKRLYELEKERLNILSPTIEEEKDLPTLEDNATLEDNVDCLNCGWEGFDHQLLKGSYCPECEQTEFNIY